MGVANNEYNTIKHYLLEMPGRVVAMGVACNECTTIELSSLQSRSQRTLT